jgi:phosphohistidine swiveling domain-containing protein
VTRPAGVGSVPPAAVIDPLHGSSYAKTYWSTTNVAEAMPGVQTPLGWTMWAPICELAIRGAFAATGALPRREVIIPDRAEDRTYNIFYGRAVLQVDFFFRLGNMLPGTSGAAVVKQWLDFVPQEYTAPPTRRRYPIVAARMPATFASLPRQTRRVRAETEIWYGQELARIGTLDREATRLAFLAGVERLRVNMGRQAMTVLCGVQPVFDQLQRLIERVGGPTTGLLRGYGSHEETRMVADLWACSRGRLGLEDFQRRHGYHGPNAGEIASVVWREDAAPLKAALDGYRGLGEHDDPEASAQAQVDERRTLEAELIAALPRSQRLKGRAILALAHRYLPLRGVGKVAFLQPLDVARASARRYGRFLTEANELETPDDVFFLTVDEIRHGLPADVKALIDARRERWEHYRTLDLPPSWQGEPTPVKRETEPAERANDVVLQGTGSSPGVVEGTVRVVTDPAEAEVEVGDILVARTTDPSWASIMFLCSGLVVDIGGLLSHAAVVARELGVPCVMGTEVGTAVLRSGDRCRVDGNTGVVEVLERSSL